MASASAELDIELESFITMLYTCEAAIYLDAMPSRKHMFLGFIEPKKQSDTNGQAILENIRLKIKYLKNRNKNEYGIKILCQVVVEKINPKLKKYTCVRLP